MMRRFRDRRGASIGTQEYVLPFEEGVKLLIGHGKFAFPEGKDA